MYNPNKKQPEEKMYGVKLLPLEGDIKNAINEHILNTIWFEEEGTLEGGVETFIKNADSGRIFK